MKGRTILLTGTTGFLAKALLEKLLRDVPEMKRIYLLIRPRRGGNGDLLSAKDRLWRDVVSSASFDRVRRHHGDDWKNFVSDRLRPITGDLVKDRFGLDDSLYESLCDEVDIVINSAATVSFDERLDDAINTNMLGPQRLLDFAKRCQSAQNTPVLYFHVSTAYVSGWREGDLPATPFSPGDSIRALRGEPDAPRLDIDAELKFCDEAVARIEGESLRKETRASYRRRAESELQSGTSEDRIEKRAETIRMQAVKEQLVDLGMERAQHYGWNDTYTFTKAMGEMLVVRERGDHPTVILRPSIIESSMAEPVPGWLDGFRMADPLIMAYAKGILKNFPARPDVRVDMVPVDYVVNSMVAVMALPVGDPHPLNIYQVATSTVCPLVFDNLYAMTRAYFERNPMMDRAGRPIPVSDCSYPPPEKFIRKLRLQYLLPLRVAGWFADRLPLVPRKVRARIAYKKTGIEQAIYYSELYAPYLTLSYDFDTTSTLALFDELSPEDQVRFPFDVRTMDWRRYIQDIHIPGLKQNVLKLGSENGRRIHRVPSQGEKELSEWAGTEQETIFDVLRFVSERHSDQVALEMERRKGPRVAYTYEELFEASQKMARLYAGLGVARGDRIILWSENGPEWGVAYLAATCSGIAVVPVDPQTTYDELARVIPFTETSLVVASAATFRRLRQHASDFKVPVLNLDDNLKPFDGVPVRSAEPKPCTWGEAEPQDTASIIFTSGTTVDPRGVLLTHRNILSDAMAVGKVLRPYPTDRFLSVLPLHHVFEFTGGFLMPLWGGAKITYVEAIKSRVILETMRKTRTSCMLGVPRLFEILHESIHKHVASLSLPARLAFRTNLGLARLWRFVTGRSAGRFLFRRLHKQVGGSIRLFVSGGAALDPEIFDGFALLGFPICEGYGMTETAPVLTVNPLGRAKSGSVGRPLPGVELRIDDPDDQGVGEIVVRGDMLMQGYLRNEDATRSMLRHGWLHTGDLGFLDDDGYLFITGRSKDLIVTASGKNVYPDEVEALYRKALPHVREMCVVGIRSDGGHGEEVHAVVVPDWREWTGERDMGDWRRAVADSVREASRALPTYQRIQKVHYWDEELPKTADLKIQRRVVRDAILAGRTAQTPPAAAETAPVFAQNGALSDEDVDRLLELLSSITKVPRSQTTRSSNLQFDLGMDSLMKVELLAALEEAFQVQIPDSLAAELLTVEDVTLRIADCREAEKKGSRSAYWDRVLTGASPEKFEPEPPRSRLASIGRRSFRWAGYLFYRRYLGLEVEGLDNVPPDGACILVSNHVSHLDSGAVLVALRGRAKGLRLVAARDYFFNTRLRSWFFRNVFNAIPFERRERFIEGLRHCRAALERGERLLIFPEGTRSVTGELQPFKAGIGLLAAHLQVPIIPTRIRGTFDAMPKGSYWPRPGQVHVTFGKPVSVSEPAGDSPYEVYRKVADEVRRRVEELA